MPIQIVQQSSDTNAVLTTNNEEDYIFRGLAYSAEEYVTIPDGSTSYLLDVSGISKTGWVSLPLVFTAVEGPVIITFYEGGDYSGGSAITVFNRSRMKPVRSNELIITQGATGTDPGTELFSIGGGSTGGVFTAGESGDLGNKELILWNAEDNILIDVDNQTGGSLNISYLFTWFEFG